MCGAMAGAILQMGGQIFSGIAQDRHAKAEAEALRSQEAAANVNAKAQMAKAEDASERGREEASGYREDARQLASSQRVAAGASGIETDSGSARLLYNDAAERADDNIGNILVNAGRERAGHESGYVSYKNQANNYGMEAQNARKAGKAGLFTGLLGAATTATSFDWRNNKWHKG